MTTDKGHVWVRRPTEPIDHCDVCGVCRKVRFQRQCRGKTEDFEATRTTWARPPVRVSRTEVAPPSRAPRKVR